MEQALLLGLPAGSSEFAFESDETFQNPNIDKEFLFGRKLCDIASRIIDRNRNENTTTYATTQEIDECLENLAKEMPQSWWEIPSNKECSTTLEAAIQFDRLMIQIWYYQLEGLLHLPFMLRAATERRFDYSKFSCMKASREVMRRYLAMRRMKKKSYCCKIVDFSALTASVTLLLDILNPTAPNESRQSWHQRECDRTLVQEILQNLEEVSIDRREIVAEQCVSVIKTLLAEDSPSASANGNLRLTLPYFGTICIARRPRSPANTSLPVAQDQHAMSEQQSTSQSSRSWQGCPYPSLGSENVPIISFTSSQFPPLLQDPSFQDWQLPEADTLFLNSLINTDIEGNWIL